jgi:hypothetical protein
MLVVSAVLLIFSGVGVLVLAQDEDPIGLPIGTCTQEDFNWLNEQITLLNEQFWHIDIYSPIATANQIRVLLGSMQVFCAGKFTNETHPNGIVGPIYFDGTMYEVTLVTRPFPDAAIDLGGIATLEAVSGDCGILNMILTTSSVPTETDIFQFGDDCIGLIEVDADEWELTFVRIR